MTLPKRIGVLALAGLAWTGATATVFAQQAAPDAAPKISRQTMMTLIRACRADYERHCADVERGEGRAARCLYEHRDDVSPDCRTAMRGAATEAAANQ